MSKISAEKNEVEGKVHKYSN